MKHPLISVIFLVLLATSFSACKSYPVYEEMIYDKELGFVIDIDGVIYRTLPETLWEPANFSNRTQIGRTNNKSYSMGVYTFDSDVNNIFLLRQSDAIFEDIRQSVLLYRKDITLPEFSADSFDSASFIEIGDREISNNITERYVINSIFHSLESDGEYINGGRVGNISVGHLYYSNSKIEGITVRSSLWAYENEYWLATGKVGETTHYVVISQDLTEKIVGKKMPSAKEFIEQQSKD